MIVSEVLNPFPGLRAFEQDEDHVFFGREKQIDDLLKKLRTQHFIAVVGSSGSGKSSLVKCGLLPSLHSGYMAKAGSSWKMALCRPGDDPLGNLARALAQPGVIYDDPELENTQAAIITATLRRSNLGLLEAVKQSGLKPNDNLLIVVDQFEELFRFSKYERTQHAGRRDSISFVELLLNACRREGVAIYIVLTMRSDFIGECAAFPGLPELINRSQYLVPRMSREEQKDAIAGPIAVSGATVTQRLLTCLLNDVGDNPDQLPILQHALLRTWNFWKQSHAGNDPIDLDHYQAIGTMAEALSLHAEEAYGELQTEKSKKVCEILFKTITEKGEERQGIRRPTKLGEICQIANATRAEVVEVIEVFRKEGRSFLMPPVNIELNEDAIIDISHESLMRIWQRLIKWVSEETQSAEIYKRLAEAAGLFQNAKSGLWRDPELQFALNWQEESRPNRHWAQRYDPSFERAIGFLKESKRQYEFEALQKRTQEKTKIQRMRIFAIVLGTAAIVSILLLIVVVIQKDQVDAAETKEIHAINESKISHEKEQQAWDKARRALADAENANRDAHKSREDVRRALDSATNALQLAEAKKVEADKFKEEARLAQKDADSSRTKAVKALLEADENRNQAKKLRQLALAQSLGSQSLREYHNNNDKPTTLSVLLAVQAHLMNMHNEGNSFDPGIYQALAKSADYGMTFKEHTAGVRCVEVSADGKEVLSGGDDKIIRIWNLQGSNVSQKLTSPENKPLRTVASNYSSSFVAAGDVEGNIMLWDRSAEKSNPVVIKAHKGVVNAILFVDKTHLLSGGADGVVKMLDVTQANSHTVVFDKINSRITALSLAPDKTRLAVASAEDVVRVYDIRQPKVAPLLLPVKGSRIKTLAFSPDGRFLALGAENGFVFIWNTSTNQLAATLAGHLSCITGIAFRPDNKVLATSSTDGSVRLWSYLNPELEPIVLRDHRGWVWSIAFAPDGRTIISSGEDKTVRSSVTDIDWLAGSICQKVERNLTDQEWSTYVGDNVSYEKTCNNK